MKELVSRLARDRVDLSRADKEDICLQFQTLEDFNIELKYHGI
jgi:hypothetical protein